MGRPARLDRAVGCKALHLVVSVVDTVAFVGAVEVAFAVDRNRIVEGVVRWDRPEQLARRRVMANAFVDPDPTCGLDVAFKADVNSVVGCYLRRGLQSAARQRAKTFS